MPDGVVDTADEQVFIPSDYDLSTPRRLDGTNLLGSGSSISTAARIFIATPSINISVSRLLFFKPLSFCLNGIEGTYLLQLLQVFLKSLPDTNDPYAPGISAGLSKNCSDRPPPACHAMWQCMSHAPGLSVWKAITLQPEAMRVTTSLRAGFWKLSLLTSLLGLKVPVPEPRITKS